MGEALRALFGGSKTTQQSSSTPSDMTPDVFKNLRPFLSGQLTSLATKGGPEYTGPLTADMSDNEKAILGDLMARTGPGTSREALLEGTLRGDFLPGSPGGNPFLDAAIKAAQRPTLQGLTETLSRDLPGRFTANGQFVQPQGSSAFDRAAAIATRGASDALADIATNMSFGAHEAERGRQQQAVQLSQAEVDTTIKNLQAQALPRLIQDQGIDRALSLFQERTQSLLQVLQLLAGVTAPVIANTQQASGMSTTHKGIVPAIIPKGLSFPA